MKQLFSSVLRSFTQRAFQPGLSAFKRAAVVSLSSLALLAGVFLTGMITPQAMGQSVVPVGPSGSYASYVPSANWYTDSYYGLPAGQLEPFPGDSTPALYNYLHMSPSLIGQPIPTTHWWTDMLMANRSYIPTTGSDQYILQQDLYGGQMWFYPGMIQPQSYGLDFYFPNAWNPANPAPELGFPNGAPQGGFNVGPVMSVQGDIPYYVPSGDIVIADFENGYPSGTVITGTKAFATPPSSGSGLTGMLGNFCASTRDGGNGVTGTCTLPSFTVTKQYLNFLICGGTYTGANGTCVNLIVGGTTVLTVSGSNSTNFNWVSWDISQWNGQTATVQIVDNQTGSWGFVACDQVVESATNNMVGRFGGELVSAGTVVTNWGDWNVDFTSADTNGHQLGATMVRGIPFTWTTWTGMNPKFIISGTGTTFYDINNNVITVSGSSFVASSFSFNYVSGSTTRAYGVFLPANTTVKVASTYVEPQLSGSSNYMVLGYLPATTYLASFAPYAFARPTNTAISWNYSPTQGLVNTTWNITTTAMDSGTETQTIQGWLPHHYRTTTNNLNFEPYTYLTPRGTMKCAPGNSFNISFPFVGIAPVIPAPISTGTVNDYQPALMETFMTEFQPGTMLGETYGSGKALGLCAQYMAWANQMGDTTNFNRLKSALETALETWLAYVPGTDYYFAYYPNWHFMVGWNASYGSQAFNDVHFHYGYFAMAMATLGMYDQQFLNNYGPMMETIVKSYGNWDRTDTTEPFLRQFDVWEGHNNAGGTSSPTGENEESSSEGIQAWSGMFLLGSMMNNSAMQAAGAMGFSMESCAINEYWQDIYQTNFPSTYGMAGNGQVWSNGLVYGTYFSADPMWVYAIQYCPSNHWMNYLTRYNTSTVLAKYNSMWTERNNWANNIPTWTSTSSYPSGSWVNYNQSVYSLNGTSTLPAGMPNPATDTTDWFWQATCTDSQPDCLGDYPGCMMLVYQSFLEPDTAAAEFATYYANGEEIVSNAGDVGFTYYLINGMRVLGAQDFTSYTSIPTSAVYMNSVGVRNYVVYNPASSTQSATVYNGGVLSGTMSVPAYVTVSTTNPNYVATAPSVPSGLTATQGNSEVTVSWSPSLLATSYNVGRSGTSGGPYTTIGVTSSAPYVDTTGSLGTTYYYVVSAANSAGTSANSSQVSSTFISAPAIPSGLAAASGSGQILVTWNSDAYATGYKVGRSTTSGGPYTTVSSPSTTSYADTNVTNGTTYYYVVSATNSVGMSGTAAQVSATYYIAPSTPTGLTAVMGNEQVALSWTASTHATSYNVGRSTVSGGPYTTILTSTTTNAVDTSVTNGTTYYYVVSAVGSGGQSANSSQVVQLVLAPPVIAIDCGSTTAAVGLFIPDTDGTGGTLNTKTNTINTSLVYNPAPMAVYQTYRQATTFTYTIPGLTPNTNYDVRLHFAEIYFSATNSRVFNVTINGTAALTNYDIYKTAGAEYTANIQDFTTISSGSNGQYTIVFTATINNAIVQGIEIRALTPVITSSLTATGTNGSALSYQITATNSPTSYTASGLPAGLAVNTSTGLISGTPTVTGTVNIGMSAANANGSGTGTLILTLQPPPPAITSSLTATGTNGSAFSYQIAGSNSPTSFNAASLPAGLSVNTSTGLISGTPSATGTTSASISAANITGTGSATLVITVLPTPPSVTSALTATGTNGSAFSYTIAGSNSPTSYNAIGLPAGLSVSTSSGAITGTPTATGTTNVSISATNAGGTGSATLVITVLPTPPSITSALTATGTNGSAFSYMIAGSNSPTSYNATGLPAGLSVDTNAGAITGTPTTTGTTNVSISATNAGGTGSATLVITVLPTPPSITSALTATGTNGSAFSYTIAGSNSPTSYNATGLPTGLSVSTSSGAITGTPTATGTTNVSISATNAGGTGSATLVITVLPTPPAITSALSATGTNGSAFSYTIAASNSPTSFNATGLPTGLSVSTSTGAITGTPTATGTTSVSISATNAGGTGSATLVITVLPTPPSITSALTATGTNGSAFSYTIAGSNSPTSYNATGLPTGLSVSTSSGAITGTPTATGTTSVSISATNAGGTGSATLVITVLPTPPSITSALTATGTNGSAFSYTIAGSNSPTSYNATGLPTGLSVSTSSGAITGTPTATGTTSVSISATNAGGTGSATLVITVLPTPPSITSALTATGTNGSAFSYQITASNSPTSFNATGLPAGLSANAAGLISGTPTATGTTSVSISATNAGGTGSATLVITVLPTPPSITSALTATGTNGSAFSYTIAASNSPTSFNASGLPAGLSVSTSSGAITGTPTATGTTSAGITASNAGGSGSATLVITVVAASGSTPVITSTNTVSGIENVVLSYQITATNTPTSYNATGLPAGLSVNTTNGSITGIPTTNGTTSATISAINASGTGSATLTVKVVAPAAGTPAITSALTASGSTSYAFSYQITASNTPTKYNATGLPGGLVVNTSSGLISGTPTANGTTTSTISAINASGTGQAYLVISVIWTKPVITSAATATGTAAYSFSYQVLATNTPTSYSATGLPAGLSMGAGTGIISGNPTSTGTTTATINAINSAGTGSATVTISVASTGTDTNLALGLSTVVASSTQTGNLAVDGNDGSQGTRWAASGATFPQTWEVDLGANHTIDSFFTYWYDSSTRYYQYTIATSTDNVNWTTVVNQSSNTTYATSENAISATTARYVMITISYCSATGGYASFYEFQVYGH